MKNQNGITLVALIITVALLLILVSVGIGSIQDNGIVNYATNAKSEYEAKSQNYGQKMNDILYYENSGNSFNE